MKGSNEREALKFDHFSYSGLRWLAISNSGGSHAGFVGSNADLELTSSVVSNGGAYLMIRKCSCACDCDSNSRLRMTRHGW